MYVFPSVFLACAVFIKSYQQFFTKENKVKWIRSVVSNSLRPYGLLPLVLLLPWGFSRQEYWSGLPFPSPGDLPNPGIEPGSPTLQADSLPSEPPGKPKESKHLWSCLYIRDFTCDLFVLWRSIAEVTLG